MLYKVINYNILTNNNKLLYYIAISCLIMWGKIVKCKNSVEKNNLYNNIISNVTLLN